MKSKFSVIRHHRFVPVVVGICVVRAVVVLYVALFLAAGCAMLQPGGADAGFFSKSSSRGGLETDTSVASTGVRPSRRSRAAVNEPKRLLVVEGALSLLGKNSINVNGETFPNDCTGVVRGAYWYAGIDLARDFAKYSGNGVRRIYLTLEADGLLYLTEMPLPGDIIFWDNTYDRNKDGAWNDPLTHTGIVVAVSESGQIEYVHSNYRKGIVIEYMNLLDPDTNTKTVAGNSVFVNSAMRMRGQVVNEKWLSSHLVKEFGKGYLLQ